jgi:hypothetical protein
MRIFYLFLLVLLAGCASAPSTPTPETFGTPPSASEVRCGEALLHIATKAGVLLDTRGFGHHEYAATLCGGGPESLARTWGVRTARCTGSVCEKFPGYERGVARGVEWEFVGAGENPNQARLFFAEYADGSVSALYFVTPPQKWYDEFAPGIRNRIPVLVAEYDPAGHLRRFHSQETVVQGYPLKEKKVEKPASAHTTHTASAHNPTPWGGGKMDRAIQRCRASGGKQCRLPRS